MSLKSAREAAGLSQNQLAKASGVNPSTIRNIEQGIQSADKVVSITVAKLAETLEVPEWVIRQSNDDPVFEFLDGHLVVDEMACKKGSWDYVYFRVKDNWYMARRSYEITKQPTPFLGTANVLTSREWTGSEYLMCGLVPRGGYKINRRRAATKEEIAELMEQYSSNWSEPKEIMLGGAFGKHAQTTITVRSFPVDAGITNPISIEEAIQERGIWAAAGPFSVSVRVA